MDKKNETRKIEEAEKEPFDLKKEIWEWVKVILVAAAIALFLNTCIIANSRVPSGSMETTIMTGDRIIGSRLAYKFGGEPERGDIVIFDHETGPGNEKTRLVKRIIGLPGETVEIKDNQVVIDGEVLEETYLMEEMESDNFRFEVPEGCYLMLGDNRNNSADARSWSDPYVPKKDILAKVLIRYFPGIRRIK